MRLCHLRLRLGLPSRKLDILRVLVITAVDFWVVSLVFRGFRVVSGVIRDDRGRGDSRSDGWNDGRASRASAGGVERVAAGWWIIDYRW